MTSILNRGRRRDFHGAAGGCHALKGSIRIANGRIVAMGNLTPEPGEERLNAAGLRYLSWADLNPPSSSPKRFESSQAGA